ncbi:SBBP repeat-containing protein [candidate division KSB1 bacterium]
MKKICSVLLICILSTATYAQTFNFEWAKSVGGSSTEISKCITVNTSGFIYTTGSFNGTVDFDPGAATFNLVSSGGEDVFVQKLDANGNFIWARSMGGTSNEIGRSITTDASGFIYIAGYFEGTADFDPSVAIFNLTSNGVDDVFILKLDDLGNLIWAKSIGGVSSDRSFSITCDIMGNIYATGRFINTVDFDPGTATFNLTSSGGEDVFILKLNGSGNFVWAKSIEGSFNNEGRSITTDDSGNVYLSGNFEGTADFDPGSSTFNLTSNGLWDIFLTKLDNLGNFIWARSFGGTGRDGLNLITIDPSGNIYATGKFQSSVDFNPGAATFNLTSNGDYDIFIQKLDANGDFIWAKSIGGPNYDQGESIITDTSGNIYVTGYYQETADFDPGSSTFNLSSNGAEDVFILKLDDLGNLIWAKSIGGPLFDAGNSITNDTHGNLFLSGYFQGLADFDPGTSTYNLTSNGNEDVFVVKFSQSATFIADNSLFSFVSVFPNPTNETVNIQLGNGDQQITIYDTQGQLVYQEYLNIKSDQIRKEIDISQLPKALYLIKVIGDRGVKLGKVLKD